MCVLICLVRASYPDAPNYCLPIQPISQDGVVQPRPEVIQGHPGKTGPRGPIGPKGSQGLPGNCGCNPSELEQLSVEMQRMIGKLLECFSIIVGLDLLISLGGILLRQLKKTWCRNWWVCGLISTDQI